MAAESNKKPEPKSDEKVVQETELDHVKDMLRQYGPSIAAGLILAGVIFLALTFHRHRQASARMEASQLFMQAQTAEQLQTVVDEYPDTATAPMALLALASARFHDGAVDLAEMHYREFLERYSDHEMRPSAELGLAYVDEARGAFAEALEGFRSFRDIHGDHYLSGPARLGEARVLAQLNRYEEARALYDAILDDPENPWRAQARSDLMYMEKDLRARE